MYKDKEWRHALTYPEKRPQRERNSCSDVFDGLVYQRLRANAGRCKHFIAFAHCADAVSANKRISRSILPINLSILNYDPRVRYKKENFLLTLLMPPKMPTRSARKFYEILEDEFTTLYNPGIAGGDLKGALIMLRNDQKGKEFDLGLRACISFDGPCSVCEIMGDPGKGDYKKVSVNQYRRFLALDHPYRRDARFGPEELRPAPPYRTKARSALGVQIAKDIDSPLPFYQGYQELPLFCGLRYLHPFEQSAADVSHNIANLMKETCFVLLRPERSSFAKWRKEAEEHGVHSEIADQVPRMVDPAVANELRDLDIECLRLQDLQDLARLLGVATSGPKAVVKARLLPVMESIQGTYRYRQSLTLTPTSQRNPSPLTRYWNCGIKLGLSSNTVGFYQGRTATGRRAMFTSGPACKRSCLLHHQGRNFY